MTSPTPHPALPEAYPPTPESDVLDSLDALMSRIAERIEFEWSYDDLLKFRVLLSTGTLPYSLGEMLGILPDDTISVLSDVAAWMDSGDEDVIDRLSSALYTWGYRHFELMRLRIIAHPSEN